MNQFYAGARQRYAAANAGTLDWMLARPPLRGEFLNTKQHSITLADYGPDDGRRGPDYLYGWIEGRGLESLATHAAFFAPTDVGLAERLDAAGRRLYRALDALRAGNGHAYFCYDGSLQPVYADADGVLQPQARPADIFTYSDAFVAKGLVAGAARYAPDELPRQVSALAEVIASIEAGRFLMAEGGRLDEATLRVLIAARDPAKDATVFTSRFDDLPEPLCALWEPSSHARLKARYEAGSYCPRKALIQSDIVLLPAPGDALDNINTPEEFAQMQRQLESQP